MFKLGTRAKIVLMPIMMLLLMLSFGLNARVTFAQNFAYNGFTSYPYPLTTSATQDVIDLMEQHDLNVYRMSIRPSYSEGSHPYRPQLIQHYLDNTPDDWIIIIDANHLIDWDPFEDGHASDLKSRLKQVCTDFPDTSRVWVELFNEIFCSYNEHYDYAQELIDYVRGEGFTHTLVVNRLYTTTYGMSGGSWGWDRLNDPLDRTYQGYHPYFQSSQDRANAFNMMQTGLNMGIKLINTEIGANSFSPDEWTQTQVDALQEFTANCAEIGVGNCIWLSWGTDWYDDLVDYGYDFDNPSY